MDLVAPYSFIPTYKGLAAEGTIEMKQNKTASEVKNETLPMWTRLLMDARTYFEQSQVV